MAGVENHHTLIGQNDKGRVVVVVGLEVAADEHVGLAATHPVVLCGHDVAVDINIAQIGGIDCAGSVLVVQRPGVCEPAPCSLLGYDVAAELLLSLEAGEACQCHCQNKE